MSPSTEYRVHRYIALGDREAEAEPDSEADSEPEQGARGRPCASAATTVRLSDCTQHRPLLACASASRRRESKAKQSQAEQSKARVTPG